MTADTDLDALLAQLPKPSARELLAQIEEDRRAAEARPPLRTIIPMPDYPRFGIVRFPCPLTPPADVRSLGPAACALVHGPAPCPWAYDYDAGQDDDPVSVPVTASPEEIGRIFGERAERRAARVRARVEAAMRWHFAQAHPGLEPPEREVW
ncbi:hypothetical protein [Streptomyces afghaniensis]|uniref:hypothetical protein n=1 Tax=Streptomyces afghaniensis TaxID=66865 RepID=UPI0027862049|nr:hypothetical protein [Streptomyces afghaniensis]MDQ1018991.1 hypothetical protein [Streptomyces afghaniensis]